MESRPFAVHPKRRYFAAGDFFALACVFVPLVLDFLCFLVLVVEVVVVEFCGALPDADPLGRGAAIKPAAASIEVRINRFIFYSPFFSSGCCLITLRNSILHPDALKTDSLGRRAAAPSIGGLSRAFVNEKTLVWSLAGRCAHCSAY